ncbi:FAD:protein FMN transferase [Bifidobacterium moraviense]|nr:FAD:protein FMN transferase [Bifidobacterium sp. DSM 109958]
MTDLARLLPFVAAFPHALGCGIIVRSAERIDDGLRGRLETFVREYERTLSRFRGDSTVARLAAGGRGSDGAGADGAADATGAAEADAGVTAAFPRWTAGLFALTDRLVRATGGAIDPCVGETLVWLGYGVELGRTFRGGNTGENAGETETIDGAGTFPGPRSWDELDAESAARPQWDRDVRWSFRSAGDCGGEDRATAVTLTARRPVLLDFGACGKGYLVDLLAGMMRSAGLRGPLVIDAGGDLRVEGLRDAPLRIGLEDPADAARAVGVAEVGAGSLCASSPSRRHWAGAHHLINALDGRPVDDVAASWAFVRHEAAFPANEAAGGPAGTDASHPHPNADAAAAESSDAADPVRRFPTAVADGLATALFVADPAALRAAFPYDCALLGADRTARASAGFPGTLFLH